VAGPSRSIASVARPPVASQKLYDSSSPSSPSYVNLNMTSLNCCAVADAENGLSTTRIAAARNALYDLSQSGVRAPYSRTIRSIDHVSTFEAANNRLPESSHSFSQRPSFATHRSGTSSGGIIPAR